MSSDNVVSGENALEQKLDALKIVDEKIADEKPADQAGHKKRQYVSYEERRQQWEEIQKMKPVVEAGVQGTVKWYSVKGHYGFIARAEGEGDIFVHQSAIAVSKIKRFYLRTLAEGETVVFDVVQGQKGLEAANLSGPEGAPVQGSRFFHSIFRRRAVSTRPGEDKAKSAVKNKSEKDQSEPTDKSETTSTDKKKAKKTKRRVRKNRGARAERDTPVGKADGETASDESLSPSKLATVTDSAVSDADVKVPEKVETASEEDPIAPSTELAGVRRRQDSESTITKVTEDRCGSALGGTGDAALGAELEDAQV